MDSSAVPKNVTQLGDVIDSRKPMSNLAFESGGNLAAQKGDTAGQPPSVAMGAPDDQARMQKYGGLAKKSTPHMLLNRRKVYF